MASDTPVLTDTDFITRDGLHLPLRHWDAAHPKAIVVALHGMSDYSRAFAMPAPWWAEQGITTIAYDQRGFGGAPNAGTWAGGDAMRGDLADAVDAAHAKYPGLPVYALGESMGGAVLLSALASARPPRVSGAILIAPAVWSRGDMAMLYRVALWSVAHTLPGMHLSGSGLKIWASDNIEMLRMNGADPLFQKNANAGAVYGLVNLMDDARNAPAHLTNPPPILFLYGGNDQVIPAKPTEAVVAALGPRAEVHRYPGGYHMLLRDLHAEPRWKDVADWVLKPR
ncbi:MAG TPA: alpha/beta hydrolase [Rhizomicrobium sp.]|jgi:alpha-beta hydrolase superfamily lysophospholipase